MNRQNVKLFLFFIIALLSAFLAMYLFNNYKIEKKNPAESSQQVQVNEPQRNQDFRKSNSRSANSRNSSSTDQLAEETQVIAYVKENRRLPEYYITKSEARNQGWVPSKGNLCDVLPGRVIGGDRFSNREKTLPKGDQYFEADVNYECGHRQADRIVFTKNGDVWLTKDHYRSFQKQ